MNDEPKPSGTVVVLRDAEDLEVLLLQRASRDGKPGAWVFPGGKVDATDRRKDASAEHDARRAAAREAAEEAALALEPETLVPISRWITPKISPKRFDTWFFLVQAERSAAIRVDGQEIGAHRWLRPREALSGHHDGSVRLAPPTFVTLCWLTEFQRGAEALDTWAPRPIPLFEPRIVRQPDGACILYAGDAGYEAIDPNAPGPRHRLWAGAGSWRYELRIG